ncbi:2-isopropylmalate synthase [Candidatus Kaiserbacteria bacterium RIFCSPHIGHO2_02_FULL_55_25]|uniref:2-isopropylmalate synthase n=1 Tax=Candidatus Kaiserbacteria bacterium RIFCSPHIGHO2_02_FULL_55_25 TaxID=1798498 RepID=A0A1F6E545_9BACT|nr:MAG: 2-isopropylmalate synthase [Candidatus Kaiserbacteria bacterium RIFCSPHIGHO2_01_FULL_55_79]OGG68761.1 MAG: 2-isopropylmalate synthase [Candidatus Kaiserbacteria bacterium RIFCSPHIGHO2_02_FULL_55_25]OGG84069.1 MAG: 2-isopropylmalate synthase [Candidatus Kaiserbacteria bacterium RIFCSPLOWO2_01_FULL_55_25]
MSVQTGDEADHVYIFDTTLRDGEQCPGATMTHDEKLEVAELLDNMGVDIIEAGFPAPENQDDFHSVQEIGKRAVSAVVCALTSAKPAHIDSAAAAIKFARRGRIHTFISTSPDHMKLKLQMSPEEVFAMVVSSVQRARNLCGDVEWSAEDATRTEIDFLCRCVEAAIKAGATTINLPDTLGYATPEDYYAMFKTVRERVPNSDKVRFSVHCHDDLDMSTANSLAGVRAGARQIECTVNGIGERAGNASLESVVMAMRVRQDVLAFWTGIESTMLTRASKLVSAVTSFPVQYNKAIVGRNAFAHESGIHQDGMIKGRLYEIMTPESVGASTKSLVMGKHSGSRAMRLKLGELGYQVGDNELADIMVRFKALAARKKEVYDEDIEALVNEEIAAAHDRIKLHRLKTATDTSGEKPWADISLMIDGEQVDGFADTENGVVDAIFDAIRVAIPNDAKLELYQVHMIEAESQSKAQAEVHIRLSIDGRSVSAKVADPDTLVASAKSYLSALSKLLGKGLVVWP